MNRLAYIYTVTVLQDINSIKVQNPTNSELTYRKVLSRGKQIEMTGRIQCDVIKKEVAKFGSFYNYINSEDFCTALENESSPLIDKIGWPDKKDIYKHVKEVLLPKYAACIVDEEDIVDYETTYAVRTSDGSLPPMFITGITDARKQSWEIKQIFAYKNGLGPKDYFRARECTYSFFLRHPEKQERTDGCHKK